jgi:hypothetical protein
VSSSRSLSCVEPEVLEPLAPAEVWAHPVPSTVVYVQAPVPVVEPEPAKPSKAVPWALIALALAILLVSLYASWHTALGPQLVPVHRHPVDLVGPSR